MLHLPLEDLLHADFMPWMLGLSVFVLIAGIVLVPVLVIRMPADYFARPRGLMVRERYRHPLVHALLIVLKNALGFLLLVAGIAMLVLPGQGVLTILASLSLLDFPGKRRLERRLLSVGPVRRAIDAIRQRAGRPPAEF